jgi:hypothetical protein
MMTVCKDSCDACSSYNLIGGVYEHVVLGEPGDNAVEYKIRKELEKIEEAGEEKYMAARYPRRRKGRAGGGRKGEDDEEDAGGDADADVEDADLEDDYDAEAQYLVSAPSVGLGTAGLGDGTAKAVADAIRAGYTLIDTAEVRGAGGAGRGGGLGGEARGSDRRGGARLEPPRAAGAS